MTEESNTNLEHNEIPNFVKKAVMIASLGGILFGYDMGVIAVALPQLTNEFELTNKQSEMVVSFLFLGGALGSTVGGTICDTSGRKLAIILTDIMFVLGAVELFFSRNFVEVLIGRVIIGFAVAVSGIADVSYLHEISPSEWRGAIVSVNEACISLGFLVSFFAGYGISQLNPNDGWRYMFGAGCFIAVLQCWGMMYMPESPVWLSDKGREDEAKAVLELISGRNKNNSAEVVVNQTKRESATIEDYGLPDTNSPKQQLRERRKNYSSLDIENSDSINEFSLREGHNIFKLFLASYRQVIIAIFLSVMQQFCGHPNVLNYAPEIFNQIGVASLFSTLLLGILKVSVTCFVILKIEHFDGDGELPMISRILAIIGIFGVAGGYACSFGPLTWLLVSELFPSSIRGRALGFSTIITYLAAAFVSYTFLSVQDWLQPSAPFAIYFILTFFSIGFTAVSIPDTKGKDPDAIQADMETMWFWRTKKDRSQYIHNVSTIESSHQVV